MKNNGAFADFGTEVPKAARQFMAKAADYKHLDGTEIAVFEPKKDEHHLKGQYYVGLIVEEAPNDVPDWMDVIELKEEYVTARGSINQIGSLHSGLVKWAAEQGFRRNLHAYIVETYHPLENGDEEVEVYLPVYA
ncbi:GyrI-like domain-containing protein [Lysinibacillus sphaericus]